VARRVGWTEAALDLGGHRMIYQVSTDRVFIIGLVHGARDLSNCASTDLISPGARNSPASRSDR
jgi:hypothetical protein